MSTLDRCCFGNLFALFQLRQEPEVQFVYLCIFGNQNIKNQTTLDAFLWTFEMQLEAIASIFPFIVSATTHETLKYISGGMALLPASKLTW